MTVNIASLFDRNYLLMALVLYESARRFIPHAKFWFLCLDDESKETLEKCGLENATLMTPAEMNDDDLLERQKTRTRGEFAFTAKSNWLAYLIRTKRIAEAEMLVWADADIMFYSSPQPLLDRICSNCSIAITPHSFPANNKHLAEKNGVYNAGLILFKVDSNSAGCIREWSKQCIAWCFNRLEDGKFGDQMYLNDWHGKYAGICDIPDKGVNLGPWNIRNYSIKADLNGSFSVDGEPLVCYHFHGLKSYLNGRGKIRPYPVCVFHDKIYGRYLTALQREFEKIKAVDKDWRHGFAPNPGALRLIKQQAQRIFR